MEMKVRYFELIITALSDTEYPIVVLNYKPDVQISRIRFSDWLHRRAHGGRPKWTRRR